ncbi:hypothetical protein CMK17_03335 [Candidatus Poribacteria bacterium]|nr:hypothetical protein [Candidatus Poribacteria bacterium]
MISSIEALTTNIKIPASNPFYHEDITQNHGWILFMYLTVITNWVILGSKILQIRIQHRDNRIS